MVDEALILRKLSEFRNIVVHRYDRIEDAIIIGILKKDLNDFVKYKNAIVNILKQG